MHAAKASTELPGNERWTGSIRRRPRRGAIASESRTRTDRTSETSLTSSSSPPPNENEKKLKDGRYTLLRRLGEGSQGETYEARDNGAQSTREHPRPEALAEDFQRYVARARAGETPDARGVVAIKCFRVNKAKAWKDVELAEREARTLASLDHPRLPKYIEHFEEDGALYLVMEKIEGESLASLRSRKQTLGVAEVTRMLEDIADALRYLHGRAPFIVHRDIKPGNVIRRPDGSYALVDFGAVRDWLKPAGGSTVVGTFGYMAPEQFQGRASPKSDVYGLGATAVAMLTGCEPEELPHEGLASTSHARCRRETSPGLVRALSAMLQPDPDRRVDSVDDALAFLRAKTTSPTLRRGPAVLRSSAEAAHTRRAAPAPASEEARGSRREAPAPRSRALETAAVRPAPRREARAVRRARHRLVDGGPRRPAPSPDPLAGVRRSAPSCSERLRGRREAKPGRHRARLVVALGTPRGGDRAGAHPRGDLARFGCAPSPSTRRRSSRSPRRRRAAKTRTPGSKSGSPSRRSGSGPRTSASACLRQSAAPSQRKRRG